MPQAAFSQGGAVVYTAMYGDYDTLKPQPVQDVPCDFICFTDKKDLADPSGCWHIILAPQPPVHPRMQAKYFKLMSHRVFPDGQLAPRYDWPGRRKTYDFVVWTDASIRIFSSAFVREICGDVGENKWAMPPHPQRDCIYREASYSTHLAKYKDQPLEEQAASYRAAGHPEHWGLWACGLIARSGQLPEKVKALGEAWWEENLRWSYQDQVSLPYLLRRHHVGVDIIPRSLSDGFGVYSHKRDN